LLLTPDNDIPFTLTLSACQCIIILGMAFISLIYWSIWTQQKEVRFGKDNPKWMPYILPGGHNSPVNVFQQMVVPW